MKHEYCRSLYEQFPLLYANIKRPTSRMRFGVCCGDGWYEIVRNLSEKLEAMIAESIESHGDNDKFNVAAKEVREYEGYLQFMLAPGDRVTDKMKEAIALAENESIITCETCGEKGRLLKTRLGMLTTCKKHERQAW